MLRSRNFIKSIHMVRLMRHSKYARGLSSETEQSKIESAYSLPYIYHTPTAILQSADAQVHMDDILERAPTAHATSIEEVKREKTTFDVYRDLLLDSGNTASDTLINDDVKLKELYKRQLDLEQELRHSTAVNSIKNILKLQEMGKSANLKSVQKILLEWYEPLVVCLDEKVEAYGTLYKLRSKIKTRKNDQKLSMWQAQLQEHQANHEDLSKHGPILNLISSEKLAVITMNAVVNHILGSGNKANVAMLCKEIGEIVETEVNLAKQTGERLWIKSWQKEQVKDATGKPQVVKALGRQIRKYYGMFPS